MSSPWMIPELVVLPKEISFLAMIPLLLACIAERRQEHIGRIGIASNAFFLWQIFYPIWVTLPEWFQIYLNIGTIFALIAIASYLLKIRLPSEYYSIAYILYGSFSVLIVIVYFLRLL